MRFLIAQVLAKGNAVDFRNLDQFVPDVYSARDAANHLARPRFIKAHHAWFDAYPHTLYIVRDYRDVMVSYFHYQRALGAWKDDFSSFLRSADTLHPFGSWKDHVEKALAFREQHPDRLLLLRYEDLHSVAEKQLAAALDFCDLQTSEPLTTIIERCRFENLKSLEEKNGSAFRDRSDQFFFREGAIGSWKQTFSEADLDFVMHHHGELLKRLGYPESS